MPEPDIPSIVQIRKRIAESEARLASLEAELSRLGRERQATERSGPTSRQFELKARMERLSVSRDELHRSLLSDRAALREALRAAVASEDPESEFKRLDAGYPVLLLPVAIETRFLSSARALMIRVFPDDIHVNSHEPEFTDLEAEHGAAFQASLAAAALEPERRETLEELAWSELNQRLGPGRAAWVVRVLRDSDAANVLRRADTWTRPPHCNTLPDRWLALGYRGGQRVFTRLGNPIPDDLEVGPTPVAHGGEPVEGSAVQPGLRWLVDLDEAVRVGMALRVPYDLDPDLPNQGVDQLLVLGVKSTLDAREGTRRLTELLDAHHYTSGLAILRQGTPTNNTSQAAAGYSGADPSPAQSLDRELRRFGSLPAGPSNAKRLAWAWGLSVESAQVSLRSLENADLQQDLDAEKMNAALWPITWGYFLTRIMRPENAPISASHEARIDQIRPHFLRHVRARGPLPAFRVGDQPYGILPAVALNQWRPADKSEVGFERDLADLLLRLREFFRESRRGEGGPNADPLESLRLNAVSSRYQVRSVQGPEFQRNLIDLLLDPNRTEARALREIFERKREAAEALLRRLELPLPNSVLAGCILAEFAHQLGDNLTQSPRAEPGRPLQPDYIQWLLNADFLQIRAQAPPDLDPAQQPLLYLLLRHAALAEFADTAALVLGRVQPGRTLRIEPELVDIAEPNQTPTAWRVLETQIHQEGLPDQSLGSILNGRKERASPLVPAKFSEFWSALRHLRRLPAEELELLMRETLDLCAHRFDAWVTSLADKRLATLRSTPGFEEGIHLGGFGWVEDLRPAQAAPSDGYIHAPSLAQAATAAVLRNGFLAHRQDSRGQALSLNLESKRVDSALQLLDGIGQGQSLGALLGYRFERGLHEGHPGVELDEFIPGLRARFGPGDELIPSPAQRGEEIPPTLAIDGLRLHRHWESAVRKASGDAAAQKLAGYLAVAEAVGGDHAPLPREQSDPRTVAFLAELDQLDEAVDALADLSLAESVHQLVEGNPERAAGITGAVSAAGLNPPQIEVVRTPRTGVTISHRVLALFSKIPPRAPGWNTETPRARAEPFLDAWVGSLLGDAHRIRADVTFQSRLGTPPLSLPRLKITVAELGLGALDFVHLAEGNETGSSSELAQRILFQITRNPPPEVLAVDQISISFQRGPAWTQEELSYRECMEPLRAIRQLLGASRPLRVPDLALPEDQVAAGWDLDELRARASEALDGLLLAGEALHDLFEVAEEARHGLADWLRTPDGDFHNLLDLPQGSDLASVARNHDLLGLETTGLGELNTTRRALRRFADFGLPGGLPVSLLGEDGADRAALLEQAFSLYQEVGKRLAAARQALAAETAAPEPEKRVDWLRESLRSIFGPSFQVIAKIDPENAVAEELERVLNPANHESLVEGDAEAAGRWLEKAATVRDRLRALEDCFFHAELFGAPADRSLQVGHLPYRREAESETIPRERWVALPFRPGERPVDNRFSLLVHLPTPWESGQAGGIRGLLIDEWSEIVPNRAETTGLTFHFDSPAARPPQTLLLAVPPVVEEGGKWNLEWLERIILETMELAKLRTVDLSSLHGLGQFLPTIFLAHNLDADTVSTDFTFLRRRASEEDD